MPRNAIAAALLLISASSQLLADAVQIVTPASFTCADPANPGYSYSVRFDGTESYTVSDESGSETGSWVLVDGTISFSNGPLDGSEASFDGENLVIPTLDAAATFRCRPD